MTLTKLYYWYQISPKRYNEFKELNEMYNKTIPKPLKAGGDHWILCYVFGARELRCLY